ncbi:MAG TPA: group 1 truncated hemoglobin, partial [candidate division Zixibacteria bacterium]|nr:group 1 truncated hemoglobin [candidate division Zixibacteria bacterium]
MPSNPHTSRLAALLSAALLALALAAPLAADEAAGESAATPDNSASLYDRLGGVYSIAEVVDNFIDRLYENDILNANPEIVAAHERVTQSGLKYRVTTLVCQLTGGPQVYHGRSLKEAHAHLNINEAQWNEMVRVFGETL